MLLEVIIVHDSNVSLSTNACIYSMIIQLFYRCNCSSFSIVWLLCCRKLSLNWKQLIFSTSGKSLSVTMQ